MPKTEYNLDERLKWFGRNIGKRRAGFIRMDKNVPRLAAEGMVGMRLCNECLLRVAMAVAGEVLAKCSSDMRRVACDCCNKRRYCGNYGLLMPVSAIADRYRQLSSWAEKGAPGLLEELKEQFRGLRTGRREKAERLAIILRKMSWADGYSTACRQLEVAQDDD